MRSTLPISSRIIISSAAALALLGAAPALAKDAKTSKPALSAIKGESMDDKHKGMMSSDPTMCDAHHAQPTAGIASDPEEGGQIARTGGGSSDPEEGGEATAAAKTAKGKVHVSEMSVTKLSDKSSTKLMDMSAPGGCRH